MLAATINTINRSGLFILPAAVNHLPQRTFLWLGVFACGWTTMGGENYASHGGGNGIVAVMFCSIPKSMQLYTMKRKYVSALLIYISNIGHYSYISCSRPQNLAYFPVGTKEKTLFNFVWLFNMVWIRKRSQKPKSFQDSPSHRIVRHMHEALNIDENKKLIVQFTYKLRDESFDPN